MQINQICLQYCLTVYDFLTRVNSSRTRCFLLNCTWLQVWPVTTTCRYLFRAEFFFSISPVPFSCCCWNEKKLFAARVVSTASVTVRIVLRLLTPFCFTDHKLENVGPLLVDYLDMRSLWYCPFKAGLEKYLNSTLPVGQVTLKFCLPWGPLRLPKFSNSLIIHELKNGSQTTGVF